MQNNNQPTDWLNLTRPEEALGMLLELEAPDNLSYSHTVISKRWCNELKAKFQAGIKDPTAKSAPSPDYRPLISGILAKLHNPGRLQLVYMLATRLYAYERIHG